jgi:tetratricopeptide (TPR) repeat protein
MRPESEGRGFFRAGKARHAEEAIGRSEGLVAVLRLTQADLEPAEQALRIAKDLFRSHEFSKALSAARRAETLALTLDERFAAYQKAREALRIRITELQRLGLHTEEFEAAEGRAQEKIATAVPENGVSVPNYLEARVVLERAAQDGRALLMKANTASNRIFLAEMAIEALGDMEGITDSRAFAQGALVSLEHALEDATRELAVGNVDQATHLASEIESRAERLRAAFREAGEILDRTEARLGELRSEGIVTERIERQIAYARDMRAKGLLEPCREMAQRLQEDAVHLAESHAKAVTGLQDAEVLYSRLVREGFQSYEADAAIKDARRALKEGNYVRALENVERAHGAFVRRRNAREALAKALLETQKRVELLKNAEFPMLPDVQEVLGRAEREFRQGNYSGSSEDLQIATVLLSQASRATPHRA